MSNEIAIGAPSKPAVTPSAVVRVVFFEDRAEVTRRAMVPVEVGEHPYAIGGLSPAVDDASVEAAIASPGTAEAAPAATLHAARLLRRAHEGGALTDEALLSLEEAYYAAARVMADATRAQARKGRRRAQDEQYTQDLLEWIATVPRRFASEGDSKWKEAWERIVDDLNASRSAWYTSHEAAEHARAETYLAAKKLQAAESTTLRHDAVVELDVDAKEGGLLPFDVKYRLPCALWRPEHVVVVRRTPGGTHGGTMELLTLAAVWQRTGESWTDVDVVLSTARPKKVVTVPLLSNDVLALRPKTDEEKKKVVIEVREQAISTLGPAGAARALDEMPGVDDGGQPMSFALPEKATIPSDGRPVRLEIATTEIPCEIARVAWPELSPSVFFRVTATWTGKTPLLAGPAHVTLDDVAAGRQKMKLVPPGEAIELSAGTDDELTTKRAVEKKDDTGFLGGQRRLRIVTVYVINSSNEGKAIRVVERIPVSEIEGLEVALVSGDGWKADADGILTTKGEVPAGGILKVAYTYELKASGKVVLPD